MGQLMEDNGTSNSNVKKAMEYKYGLMDQNMKDFGILVKLKGMEGSYWLMANHTKENGKMIRLMVKEYTGIVRGLDMKVCGSMISKMDLEENNGQMDHIMKDSICKERNVDKEDLSGLIKQLLKGNGEIIR